MQHCALISDVSDLVSESVVACISLFIFLVLRSIVTAVVCRRFVFCLMCTNVTSLCVLMGVVYFVVVECSLFMCCMLCKRVVWDLVIFVRFVIGEGSSVCVVVLCLFRHADVEY